MKIYFALLSVGLLSGCVTHISTNITRNPPPAERFSAFGHIDLTEIALAPPYAGQNANERALVKIQENVSRKMAPVLKKWNAAGSTGRSLGTLLIEPTITEIKFIGGGPRFWAGPLAGSSAVVMNVKISEKETGRIIATPVFYARAEAWGGSVTFGATDNLMLTRIGNRLINYLLANYDAAVGGISGFEPPKPQS